MVLYGCHYYCPRQADEKLNRKVTISGKHAFDLLFIKLI